MKKRAPAEAQDAGQQHDEDSSWPVNLDEERQLLGALILDPAQLPRVAELQPELFSLEAHRVIRRALADLVEQACTTADYLEVAEALRRRGDLKLAGGADYVSSLGEGVVLSRSLDWRVRRLRELAARRHLILLGAGLADRANDYTVPLSETIGWAISQVDEVRGSNAL